MASAMAANSEVRAFYANKTIFMTGGSGFLGICLLEKILRTIPEHGTIYLLLRPKRGKQIQERLEEIKKNQIFDTLYEDRSMEEVFSKVKAVAGDVGQDGLGLSPEDRTLLTSQVEVIFHSAATLDFGDSLRTTVNINLLGTRRMIELAKQCPKLNVFVHVSSAYVNSYLLDVEEVIYDLPRDSNELIKLVNGMDDEELEIKTPELLGKHPNTYTITKHMAEHEVKSAQALFPCAIVRPSMIIGAWKEPFRGWTISKNGPQGFLMGASKGVIRRLPVATNLIYDYIPVDIVVNHLLTAGYSAGHKGSKTVEVYHATSSTRNPFRWSVIESNINNYLHNYPLMSAVWYPNLKLLPTVQWYKFSALFVHIFPALILDFFTRITGGRPILMKLHRNVNSSLDRLEKFIFTEWKYHATNTLKLQKSLSERDKELFNLDISELEWPIYFQDLAKGARIFLSKEPLKNLSRAKGKQNLLFLLHWGLQIGIYSLIWYIFALITGWSMAKAAYILPFIYIFFNSL